MHAREKIKDRTVKTVTICYISSVLGQKLQLNRFVPKLAFTYSRAPNFKMKFSEFTILQRGWNFPFSYRFLYIGFRTCSANTLPAAISYMAVEMPDSTVKVDLLLRSVRSLFAGRAASCDVMRNAALSSKQQVRPTANDR